LLTFSGLFLAGVLSFQAMSAELTAAQVADRLNVGRSTVNLWCRQGRFPGAHLEESPVGSYWLIPVSDLKGFEKPQPGRPPKPKASGTDGKVNVKPSKKPRKRTKPERQLKTLS
jgi:hypothetical protein